MALSYGVIVDYKENEFELPHWKITTIHPETFDGWIGYDKRVGAGSESGSRPFNIGDVKPCLRPMSSMTEEEYDQLYIDSRVKEDSVDILDALENDMDAIQWLFENHFDFMGLIPKDLAIEVTNENNPYESNM